MNDDPRAEYRERFALLMTDMGLQRMVARVYAALTVAEGPTMTMPELAETLQASAGAISGAIKTLTTIGLVERVPAPGSRRDHYRIADNGWYDTVMHKYKVLMQGVIDLAADGVEAVGEDTVAGHRLAEMRDFYSFISAEVQEMLPRWEKARDSRRGELSDPRRTVES
ncbi:GbsR/MarR family transcriptional regulator [Cryptosporangium sp. NPDC048952]|uniref:GbsR/MarR family transcriptional regulator n=1 Tax=Cryptosporangium sp. NPDC048952 TaxID=3363961 RepID=UPI0037176E35